MCKKIVFSLKEIKEAIKQADANIKLEEVHVQQKVEPKNNNVKILKRGNNYDKRPLG